MFFREPFVAKRISQAELRVGIRGTDGESSEFVLPSESVDAILLTADQVNQGWVGDEWIRIKQKERVFFVSIRVTEAHRQVFNFSDSNFRKFCAQLRIGLAGMIPDTLGKRQSSLSIPVRLDDSQIEEIRECMKTEFTHDLTRQLESLNRKLDTIITILQKGVSLPSSQPPTAFRDDDSEDSSSDEPEGIFIPSTVIKGSVTGQMSPDSGEITSDALDEAVDLLTKLRGKDP